MENISVSLLNSFVVFNESKNITDAATKLRITQPALSKQLGQLERSFPIPLFTLSGRKKVLTPFGQELHRRLKDRIGNLQELVQQAHTLHADASHSTLRIAARRGVLDRVATKLQFQGCLHFMELSQPEIIQALLQRKCELGITYSIPETHELVAKPLFKEEFTLLIPKKLLPERPVYGRSLLSQLKEFPCLAFKEQDELLQALFSGHCSNLLKPKRITSNYQSLYEMAEAQMGWTLVPSYLQISEKTVWALPVSGKTTASKSFYLVYRAEFSSVAWFKTLIEDLRTCFT